MIRDNIQGKSFKKNYGYMCSCSLENFKLWFNYGTQVKTDFIPHAEGSFYESNKKNKIELLQVLQNRIKVFS